MARKRDDENLTKANLTKVIGLLEQEKPITKKAACEILNISYNTARLKKLIEEFKTKEEHNKKRRAKLRGTPLSNSELAIIAQEYLGGEPLTSISDFIYRPITLVKKAIKELNIPERDSEHSYQNPPLLEEDSICQDYKRDDLVYSARYQTPALIEKSEDSKEGPAYVIYLLGKNQCYATQPYWELADLRRLQTELNVNIKASPGIPPAYNPR